jgi:dTMP kinase
MGCFITFEGIEGSGKTTQIRLAGEFLQAKGIPVIVTEEPGGTALGVELRRLLLNRSAFDLCGESELLLFLADRAEHVRELIRPALDGNKWVLCDRFSDATLAYQGFGRGLDLDSVRKLTDFASGLLRPVLTFLFDLPVEAGLGRAMERVARAGDTPAEDRFERERIEFHRRVREGYLSLAREEPGRFVVIDGRKDVASVHREVSSCLLECIDLRKGG